MPVAALIPLLMELAKLAPGLVVEVGALLKSTNGNPTAADWKALSDKVSATDFDQPPAP